MIFNKRKIVKNQIEETQLANQLIQSNQFIELINHKNQITVKINHIHIGKRILLSHCIINSLNQIHHKKNIIATTHT
jgi:tRNA G10  N-methylase Trm11